MRRLEEIPAFCLPGNREGPPQNLRWSKQRIGLRQTGFAVCLQEYTCEQNLKSENAMDIAANIGIESWKIIREVTPRNSRTLTLSAAHWAIIFFCPMRFSLWDFLPVSCPSTHTWFSVRTGKHINAGPASDALASTLAWAPTRLLSTFVIWKTNGLSMLNLQNEMFSLSMEALVTGAFKNVSHNEKCR